MAIVRQTVIAICRKLMPVFHLARLYAIAEDASATDTPLLLAAWPNMGRRAGSVIGAVETRLLRRVGNTLVPTAKGWNALATGGSGELMARLFEVVFWRINLGRCPMDSGGPDGYMAMLNASGGAPIVGEVRQYRVTPNITSPFDKVVNSWPNHEFKGRFVHLKLAYWHSPQQEEKRKCRSLLHRILCSVSLPAPAHRLGSSPCGASCQGCISDLKVIMMLHGFGNKFSCNIVHQSMIRR